MIRHVATAAGIVLGLLFVSAAVMVLFDLAPEQPPPPAGSATESFMEAFGPTGYLTFVKLLELAGGLLVMLPRTRILGLLVLGPIVVNILAFHAFVQGGAGLAEPMVIAIALLPAFLAWHERKSFLALVRRDRT